MQVTGCSASMGLATNPHASGKPFAALEHVVNISDIYVMHE